MRRGRVIRPYFRQRIEVVHKPGVHAFDPVTEADKGAERAIRAIIDRERPDDAILGEEYGAKPGTNAWRWVLDPSTAPAPSSPGVMNGAR